MSKRKRAKEKMSKIKNSMSRGQWWVEFGAFVLAIVLGVLVINAVRSF